jgi:N-acyl-D-aspartate/D-glutamate deacylase
MKTGSGKNDLLRRCIVRVFYSTVMVLICTMLMYVQVETQSNEYDVVLHGGSVMDPESGLDAVRNIGIRDGRIVEISEKRLVGVRVIDASGLVVAPGFIDLHAHGQSEESFGLMVRDGVTTAFELEVGSGDVAAWYAERSRAQTINYGVSIGHIPVRMRVMGDLGTFLPKGPGGGEVATAKQISEMERLVVKGLEEGAVAVGFGLAYTPAASTAEFQTILKIASDFGASAHIHVRGGDDGLREALDTAAATSTSLHVVHANSSAENVPGLASGGGKTEEFLSAIEEARQNGQDVTTEAYPYEAGMTMIESALFDDWETFEDSQFPMHQWAETGERLTRESFGRYRMQGGGIIIHSRTPAMTRTAIESPLTMIASDGLIDNGRGHPRTAGTYAKVLGQYVREKGALSLMDALRKMTIEPARRLEGYVPAMANKGRIRIGADADVTVFDPAVVIDRSTYTNPSFTSEGIPFVIVNGVLVVDDGELMTNVRSGRAVRVQ